MRLQPGERRACEGCDAEMIGALTTNGKVAPVTLVPKPTGNVLLQRRADGTVFCVTFGADMARHLREVGVELRLNHFADCPQRERFSR